MYREDEFYILMDLMHFNVYAALLKDHIKKEERVIIKVFKKGKEVVIVETNNFHDLFLMDTRVDKNSDLMEFDLVFLKVLERFYCDYEINGAIYESIEGIGSWMRVKIDGYLPFDKRLKPFYLKKKIEKGDLKNYTDNEKDLNYLMNFYDLTKGQLKFSKVKKVKEIFNNFIKNI